MNNTIDTIAIALVVIGLVVYRSVTWREVKLAKLTRMPIVLGLAGLAILAQVVTSLGRSWRPSAVDVAVLAGEIVLAVGVGWMMARLSELRSVDGQVVSRLKVAGVAVFLGFVAVRVAVAAFAGHLGGTPSLLSASVLVVIAVIKLTQGVVVTERYHRHVAAVANGSAEPRRSVSELSYR